MLVARSFIVGVLAQVPQLACVLDPLDDLWPFDRDEPLQLLVECGLAFGGHGRGLGP